MMQREYQTQYRIADLGRVITGRTPPTEIKAYFGDEFPFVTPSDMDGQKFIHTTERQLSASGATLLKNNRVPAGSIAVSCIGWQMGKVAVIGKEAFTNQQINTIVPNNRVIADYLYYVLSTRREELKTLGSVGTRTPILNKSRFEDLIVMLPPLPIQRKIAAILSAYDDLIENNTRRIALLEAMAQALYREWFVRFRFPGHGAAPLVESPLGAIPEGWRVAKVGDVACINPDTIKRGQEPDIIDYVDIASVSTGRIDKVETLSYQDAPGRARRRVSSGDVIWSTVRPNRKSYSLILKPSESMVVSTGFAVVRATQVPFTYLYQALTTSDFVGHLTNRAKGSAYPAVTADDFADADILLPPAELLKLYHARTVDMLALEQAALSDNANLRQTRDLLLPRLVSGAVDVAGMEVAMVGEAIGVAEMAGG